MELTLPKVTSDGEPVFFAPPRIPPAHFGARFWLERIAKNLKAHGALLSHAGPLVKPSKAVEKVLSASERANTGIRLSFPITK